MFIFFYLNRCFNSFHHVKAVKTIEMELHILHFYTYRQMAIQRLY